MVNLSERQLRRQLLGQSLSFPLRVNPQGNLELSSADRNIRESILLILMTDVGERVARPDFGCRLSELAFAPMNSETLALMKIWVKEALEQWEPRIILDRVVAIPKQSDGRVDLAIFYRIRRTQESRQLTYPFFSKSFEP